MHLQVVVLFAKEIDTGKFFALTAWSLLNSISQQRHKQKIL
jgi:hypothetical protein